MPGSNGDPNGQDPQDDGDDGSTDLEGQGAGDPSDDDGDGGHTATGSDLEGMTSEQLRAEAIKLRTENARRRQREKESREREKAAQKAAEKQKTDAEKLVALENSDKVKDRTIATLFVGQELRDYVAEKHPEYLKLSKRILPFVDLEGLDVEDEDSVRDKVKEAVEAFVKEIPLSPQNGGALDSSGQPVGGVGRAPARGGTPDAASRARMAELFPGIYKTPRQG